MKNKLEYILLSILLGLSVLLGLAFWLNTIYNFNIFYAAHWDELSKLQASHTPISIDFYISFGVAIFIFIVGIYFIYRSTLKDIPNTTTNENTMAAAPSAVEQIQTEPQKNIETPSYFNRPPRLNLPNNMAQIAQQKHTSANKHPGIRQDTPSESPYNPIISEIFSNNGYIIKQTPNISGFTPNLFAIGNNEVVWVGGVDCDIEKMTKGIERLSSVFQETLEDIQININAFILDTLNRYDSTNTGLLVFKSIDELKAFVNEHPADAIEETDQESFDSYSEYIDTIIKYIKNM